jgi:phosphoribosylformylglycinamidine cyclo-ligase
VSYRDAGVDIEAGDRFTASIAETVRATWGDRVVGGFGGFAAGIRLPDGYDEPVLMMTTDGVGTKAEVARTAGRVEGLGHDLVAMCVDDLAAAGAAPLAMTDYLAMGRLDQQLAGRLVASIAQACELAGCALVGGETAEHPGVLPAGVFDLAGAAVGVVEAGHEVTGEAIAVGDQIVAVASPNLRSNGFSLIRALVLPKLALDEEFPGTGHSVTDVLLEPSVIYAPAVQAALAAAPIRGLAHVTGGGIAGNLRRILPELPRCSPASPGSARSPTRTCSRRSTWASASWR